MRDLKDLYLETACLARLDGLSKEESEDRAYETVIVAWLNENGASSDDTICAHCQGPPESANTLIPYGVKTHRSWLHAKCWWPWRTERRFQAQTALEEMNIKSRTATSASWPDPPKQKIIPLHEDA